MYGFTLTRICNACAGTAAGLWLHAHCSLRLLHEQNRDDAHGRGLRRCSALGGFAYRGFVFSGACVIITMLHCLYTWLILQLCGRSVPMGPHENSIFPRNLVRSPRFGSAVARVTWRTLSSPPPLGTPRTSSRPPGSMTTSDCTRLAGGRAGFVFVQK